MKRSRLAAVPLGLPIGLLGVMATGAPAQAAGEPEPVDATSVASPPVWRPIPGRNVPREQDLADEDLMSVPEPALIAYQRAETVLADALPDCHLDAALLAGIGKVETDHGRFGAWRLGRAAVMRPRLVGAPVMAPTHPVTVLADSDGGTWDGDAVADHPLGPLQIPPSLWQQVAVDGDGDGLRRPADLDDAALALGVALCADDADLARGAERRAVLRSLNDRPAYVKAVLAYRKVYAAPVVLPPVYVDTVGVVVSPAPTPADGAKPGNAASTSPTAKHHPKHHTQPAPKPQPGPATTPPPVTPPPVTPPPVTPPPAPEPAPEPTPPPPAPEPEPTSPEPEVAPTATTDPATSLTSAAPGDALAATAS